MVETIGGSHKGAYARGRTGLTLEGEEDVAAAVELAIAMREVFIAATADPYDFDGEAAAVEHLADLWRREGSTVRRVPQIYERRDGSRHSARYEIDQPTSAAWGELRIAHDYAGRTWHTPMWLYLWNMLDDREQPVGRCVECGVFFRGSKHGPSRVFCGDTCRKRAARR